MTTRAKHLFYGYCQMPQLWKGIQFGLQQFEETIIKYEPKRGIKITTNKRLGKVAEELFSHWIFSQDRYRLVFENLQIIDQKITLGELDALVFDTACQEYLHLELITKFYVYNPNFDANNINAWIGPNRNDSLQEKVGKLIDKQLPLLQHRVTQQALASYLTSKTAIKQQVLFKANLFVPLDFEPHLIAFNQDCVVGNYLTLHQFLETHQKTNTYFCPTKQDWLRLPQTETQWTTLDTVIPFIKQFMDLKQSLMVWVNSNQGYKRNIIVAYEGF